MFVSYTFDTVELVLGHTLLLSDDFATWESWNHDFSQTDQTAIVTAVHMRQL